MLRAASNNNRARRRGLLATRLWSDEESIRCTSSSWCRDAFSLVLSGGTMVGKGEKEEKKEEEKKEERMVIRTTSSV